MSTFLLSFNATTSFAGSNPPTLEILIGGVVVSSVDMVLGASSYDFLLDYTGTAPSSVSLRFAGTSGDPGDTISFTSASINNTPINVATDLTATLLSQSQSAAVTAANELYGNIPPTLGAADITGTGGNDVESVIGTNNAEGIDGLAGNDYITARGGDDEINGGAGDDYIFGEGGNDTILAGAGNDVAFGNDGDDVIFGEADNDYLIGGAGSDLLNGGTGDDGLIGDAGDDVLFGGDGNDYLVGDVGDDLLFGDDGNDIIIGGTGNDSMAGGIGDDQLIGGAGNDLISGGDGADEIIAEDGNDEISAGDGDDSIYGGAGDDIIAGDAGNDIIHSGAGADTIDGGDGNDYIQAHGLDGATIASILSANPNVVYSEETGSFYQFVTSGATWTASQTAAAATTLSGVNGHLATVTSLAEMNFLDSQVNPTNDTNIGSYWTSGNDLAVLGEYRFTDGAENGVQFWNGQAAGSPVNGFSDMWVAGQPNSTAQNYVYLLSYGDGLADAGDTGFTHSEGYIVEWEGGLFSDDNAADIISGGAGNDALYGWGGNDNLNGGADNDQIYGGAGNDILSGGSGDDLISGGNGSDTIDFSTSGAGITVDLNTGIATGNGTDTFLSIENVTGSSNADIITGDGNNNILDGGDGADIIRTNIQTEVGINSGNFIGYGGGQDAGGPITYLDNDVGVAIQGNRWRQVLDTFEITADTILEFDFRSTAEGEIHGIGFDTDNGLSSGLTFKLHGTQNWGIGAFNNYDGSGDWVHYEIDVGSFYTGTYSRIFFVNDHDSGGTGSAANSWFRNIVIHEGNTDDNTLVGSGDGDNLYGGAEIDTFDFDAITGTQDIIHNFNAAEDILDISDIITGFTGDITDHVQFTNSGDHVTLSVDVDGSSGFSAVAEIRGAADFDAAALFGAGQIIV